ncbi:YT521-B-like domain-containing protein, partial [Dipodascopsis uninucleata]
MSQAHIQASTGHPVLASNVNISSGTSPIQNLAPFTTASAYQTHLTTAVGHDPNLSIPRSFYPYSPYGPMATPFISQIIQHPATAVVANTNDRSSHLHSGHVHHRRQHHHIQDVGRSGGPSSASSMVGRSQSGSGSVSGNSLILGSTTVISGNSGSIAMGTGIVSVSSPNSSVQTSLLPRGPPRKPKQSGHALWVGNLPIVTTVLDLRDMFASPDIESVFLISKSNCAFVNYSSDAAMRFALDKFKRSGGILQGTRLVARMQRGTTYSSETQSTTGEPVTSEIASVNVSQEDLSSRQSVESSGESSVDISANKQIREHRSASYFIVKSLTVEDLELSVRTGVWATQAHNEKILNDAYNTSDNVYLIFSANKSGEYFGYAKMAGPIVSQTSGENFVVGTGISTDASFSSESSGATTAASEEPRPVDSTPSSPASAASPIALHQDLPKTTYTPATATAPAGRIIDDSGRGTIFWEVLEEEEKDSRTESKESEDEGNNKATEVISSPEETTEVITAERKISTTSTASYSEPPAIWGTPFKVTWLSTNRVPFFKTRGLKNSWNANRDVKIARDGTELDPTVGQKLLTLFHVGQQPSLPTIQNISHNFTPSPNVLSNSRLQRPDTTQTASTSFSATMVSQSQTEHPQVENELIPSMESSDAPPDTPLGPVVVESSTAT